MATAEKIINVSARLNTKTSHYRLISQLESAATSIPLNIAEGKGRNSKKEFIQFLYIARGSLYETQTLLELFKRLDWITNETFETLESDLYEIAKMLKGLINSIYKNL